MRGWVLGPDGGYVLYQELFPAARRYRNSVSLCVRWSWSDLFLDLLLASLMSANLQIALVVRATDVPSCLWFPAVIMVKFLTYGHERHRILLVAPGGSLVDFKNRRTYHTCHFDGRGRSILSNLVLLVLRGGHVIAR